MEDWTLWELWISLKACILSLLLLFVNTDCKSYTSAAVRALVVFTEQMDSLCEHSATSKTFQPGLGFGESSVAEICLAKNGQVSELQTFRCQHLDFQTTPIVHYTKHQQLFLKDGSQYLASSVSFLCVCVCVHVSQFCLHKSTLKW